MSKGSGVGSRASERAGNVSTGAGSGGSGGGGSGGGSPAQQIAAIGGISNSTYLRSGMRDLSTARGRFAGMSPAQAQHAATHSAYPIRVHVEPGKNGKPHIILNDGRHRMTAAREAGATHIRATVVTYGPRGGVRGTWTGNVKI